MDRIAQFIEAWLEDGEAFEERSSSVFGCYSNWCKENNYNAENVKNLKNAMQQKYYFDRRRPKDGGEKISMIIGCRLCKEELGAETDDSSVLSSR